MKRASGSQAQGKKMKGNCDSGSQGEEGLEEECQEDSYIYFPQT